MSYHAFGASIEPGTAEVEDILCPAGWAIKAEGEKIWCEDASGNKHPPAYQPSTKLVSPGLGVLGWSMIAAGAMVLGAMMLGGKRRARPNRRRRHRRARPNEDTTKIWHGSTYSGSDFMRLKRCKEQLTRTQDSLRSLRISLGMRGGE